MNNWNTVFEHDPRQAVADLFCGALDSRPELLCQEFPDTSQFKNARQALDEALLDWLQSMRCDYVTQIKSVGYEVYSKRLCDALACVHVLNLPKTTEQIRETLNIWLAWLRPLRLAPDCDPGLECWRVLTQRQTAHEGPWPWLHLAGDRRPEYLSVALLGLQRMPNHREELRKQLPQILALLKHASLLSNSHEAHTFFNHRFAVLHTIYAEDTEYWQALLEVVMDGFKHEVSTKVGKELLEKLSYHPRPHQKYHHAHLSGIYPADKAEYDALYDDINNPRHTTKSVVHRLSVLLDQNYAYARVTGDRFYFVLSLSKHGLRLLKRHQLSASAMGRLQTQILRGLSLEPLNPHIWVLWATSLEALGHSDAKGWVLHEMVRLFPCDEHARTELEQLLTRHGKDAKAERRLREVVTISPDHARQELSETTAANSVLSRLLDDLQSRSRLHREFNQALSTSGRTSDTLNLAAAQGNALACFYQQWLNPNVDFNWPPHAFAAHACRLYQAGNADFQQLNHRFPEHRLVSRFLNCQLSQNQDEADKLLKIFAAEVQTPLHQFMASALAAGNPADKDQLILTVLACVAEDVLKFVY